jgi:hypothetical protein
MFYLAVYKTWLLKEHLNIIDDLKSLLIKTCYQICKLRILKPPKVSDLNNKIYIFNDIVFKQPKLSPRLYKFDKVFLTFDKNKIISIAFDYISMINTIEYFEVDFIKSGIKEVYYDQEVNKVNYYNGVAYDQIRLIL